MAFILRTDVRFVTLVLCLALHLDAQLVTNRLTVIPQASDAATGEVRLREKLANGTNYVGFKPPSSITSNVIWTLPAADGTANFVLKTDGAGVLSWTSNGGGGVPFDDKTGAPATNPIMQRTADATAQWGFDLSLIPASTLRTATVPNGNFTFAGLELNQTFTGTSRIFQGDTSFAPTGVSNNVVDIHKLRMFDNETGKASAWDSWSYSGGVGANNFSHLQWRDESGNVILKLNAVSGGTVSRYGEFMGNFLPSANATYDLGCPTAGAGCPATPTKWKAAHFSGAVNAASVVTTSISTMEQINPGTPGTTKLGNDTNTRFGKLWLVDLDISGTCTGSGCGSAGLPVVDTTGVVKGSADATKILRFEVDGFTTATTRVLTPQNADYIIAGLDLAQTFTAAQSITVNSTAAVLNLRNSHLSGYSMAQFFDNAGAVKGLVGWGNASSGFIGMHFGTQTPAAVRFITDASARWEIGATGTLQPLQPLQLGDVGTNNRISFLYGDNADFARAGVTGNSVTVRDFKIADQFGGTSTWVMQATASGVGTSILQIKDNSGGFPLRLDRSTGVNRAIFDQDLVPSADGGKNIGTTLTRWGQAYFSDTVRANAIITESISTVAQLNPLLPSSTLLGTSVNRFGKLWTLDLDASGATTLNNVTITGTCTGCGGGAHSDATPIIRSATPTNKDLIISAAAISDNTTRTLSAQNANYIIAGTNIAQTFTARPTISWSNINGTTASIANNHTQGYSALELQDSSNIPQGFVAWSNAVATIGPSHVILGTTTNTPIGFFTNSTLRTEIDTSGNLIPAANLTYALGTTTRRWTNLFTNVLTVGASASFGGPITAPLIDKGGSVFDLRSYGALCDGTTDDTAAFNATVAAAQAAGSGMTVWIPPTAGGCKIGPVTITGNSSNFVNLRGAGSSASRLVPCTAGGCNVSGQTVLTINQTARTVKIDGFTIDGWATGALTLLSLSGFDAQSRVRDLVLQGGVGATALKVQSLGETRFQNLQIMNSRYGIYINGDAAGENYFENIGMFTDQAMTTDAQIYYVRTTTADVGGSYFSDIKITTAVSGPTVQAGMRFAGPAVGNVRAFITITDCIADWITGSAYQFENMSVVSMQNSWGSSSLNDPALKITGGADLKFSGNHFFVGGTTTPSIVQFLANVGNIAPDSVAFENNVYEADATSYVFAMDTAHPVTQLTITGESQTSFSAADWASCVATCATGQFVKFVGAMAPVFQQVISAPVIYTHTTNGKGTLRLENELGENKFIRVDPGGAFAIINNAFNHFNFLSYDNGDLAAYGVITNTQNPPVIVQGAGATNGNILLKPGNVAANSTVWVESARLDTPGLIIKDASGTTTSNGLELRQNNQTIYFKVIAGTDSGAPGTVVTRDIVPATALQYDLGKTFNRWANGNFVNINVSGTCTGCGGGNFVTLDTTQTITGQKTFSAGALIVSNDLNIGGAINFSNTMSPLFGGLGSIGNSARPYGSMHTYSMNFYGTTTGDLLPSISTFYNLGGASNVWNTTYTKNLNVSDSAAILNLYLRRFSGGDANCSGVTDGWVGFRTDTNQLQICSGNVTKKVTLN